MVPAATQLNGNDCGLYAAAFEFQWAMGSMVCDVLFDNSAMRPHLQQCLQQDEVRPSSSTALHKQGRKKQPMVQMI